MAEAGSLTLLEGGTSVPPFYGQDARLDFLPGSGSPPVGEPIRDRRHHRRPHRHDWFVHNPDNASMT
jgi:hypothetical protein